MTRRIARPGAGGAAGQQTSQVDFDAVVLAGGGGTRLGGQDKAGLKVGGISLLDRVLEACAGARRTVVVGSPRPTVRVVEWTLEQPPGSGPLAGLAAGVAVLEHVTSPAPVLVLATDLPQLRADDVSRLVGALVNAGPQVHAALFTDDTRNAQPLTAIYRRADLARAIAAEQPVANRPMRAMLSRLTTVEVPDRGAAADIDTVEQLAAAQAAARGELAEGRDMAEGRRMSDQVLHDWVARVCAASDLDPAVVDISAVLDLAKDAAHGIARPAAPLTTFMAGYLAGQAAHSGDPAAVARMVLADLAALIPPPPDLGSPLS